MFLHGSALYLFGAIGLADTIYLSYRAITKTDVACWWFPEEWCHKVQYSKFSKTFGIPNPYLGLLMFAAILVLTGLTAAGIIAPWVVKAVIVFGFAFSMYFTFLETFVLKAFCTWCVISAACFTLMVASLLA